MRDGEPADVYMVLMVHVSVTKDGPLVLAAPNNGIDAARYGLLYTAPQRFNEFYWVENSLGPKRVDRDVLIWQHLQIDEHGKVIQRASASALPRGCIRRR
jgi:hypothetical protein